MRLRLQILLVLLLLVSAPVWGQGNCTWTEPHYLPGFSLSGAWHGSQVAFVDNRADEVVLYSMRDGYVGSAAVTEQIQPFNPSVIKPVGQHFLLQLSGARLVYLNQALRPEAMRGVKGRELGDAGVIQNIYAWNTVGPDVVACVDVQDTESDGWRHGYARFRAASDRPATFLTEFSRKDPNRVYCRLGMDLITDEGGSTFLLMMGEAPSIHRFDPNGSERILPADLGTRPEILFSDTGDIPGVMGVIEASAMPVGLYSTGGDLVVLSRSPIPEGTEWRLTRYDPHTGTELGYGILPTNANHLTVVPGPAYWAFLERGAVKSNWEHDELFGIRYIPSSAIRSLSPIGGKVCK